MLNYSKHLTFFYGDRDSMVAYLKKQIEKYEAVKSKTPKIIKRIEDYMLLIQVN